MDCEFTFCIYQRDGLCTSEEISIDAAGMCEAMIQVDLPDKLLRQRKNKILKSYEQQYTAWDKADILKTNK